MDDLCSSRWIPSIRACANFGSGHEPAAPGGAQKDPADHGVRAALGHWPRDPLGVIARDELDLLAALCSQQIQEPTPCATGVPSRSRAPTSFRSGYVNGCCGEEEETVVVAFGCAGVGRGADGER
jgi:hypothetical protein